LANGKHAWRPAAIRLAALVTPSWRRFSSVLEIFWVENGQTGNLPEVSFRFARKVRMALIETVSPVFILNFTVTGFATVLTEDDARFLLMR
jgi:hypothetical protein